MRQFQSASGRRWSVEVERSVPLMQNGSPLVAGQTKVLRFNSPGLVCELREWPADWEKIPQPQLLMLLDQALTHWVSAGRV